MKRTHARPLPSGKLSVTEATAVGSAMGVGGVGILYGLTNPVVAALVIIPSSQHTFTFTFPTNVRGNIYNYYHNIICFDSIYR